MYLILYDQKSSSKTLNQIVSKFQEKYGSKNNLEILTPTTDISDKDNQNPSFTESEKCITKEEIEEFRVLQMVVIKKYMHLHLVSGSVIVLLRIYNTDYLLHDNINYLINR